MSWIEFERPYEECCNFVGMRRTGKSNAMAYMLKQDRYNRYIFIDTARVHNWTPSNPEKQEIVRFRKGKRLEQFEELLNEVWDQGNTIVACDEIDAYETVYKMPDILDEIINRGGNRGISLWCAFRRPARCHKDLIGNALHHFIFQIFDKASVDWYISATGCTYIKEAKNLRPYHFLYWKVGKEPIPMKPVDKVI